MPIVLLIVLSALHAVDPNLERAALGLGAGRVRVFCRVVLPIALPGVLSAALFAFLGSFDESLISLFLAGVHAQTLPVRIWNSLNLLQVEPTIATNSAFLIALMTFILAAEAILRPRMGQRRGRA
jgi:ABC-type spermidine/putrescine transport system permease subunit II